ncbi:MAG: hypothetical protein DRJ15_16560 [Bacteroidetes bacterium]|nr:MAG: hypothetical protein DRJ15_16560 [Bacteroidota bacterium]
MHNKYMNKSSFGTIIIRNGTSRSFDVELRTEDGSTRIVSRTDEFFNERLGVTFSPLSTEERNTYDLRGGLKVVSLDEGLMNKGGIRTGFIVTSVNGYAVNSKSELESALSENVERVKISGEYPDGMRVTFEFGL